MYDLQPPFLGPRRSHRSSLKPEDAAAMIAQSQQLSQSKMFRTASPDTFFRTKWHSPASFDSHFRDTMETRRYAEYNPMPELASSQPQVTSKPAKKAVINFSSLPDTVMECILEQLRRLHVGRSSSSCTTCYMRDLYSMQQSCGWLNAHATAQLYKRVDISGEDAPAQLKKYKMQRGSRLRLLRRTLRQRPDLAELVRELNVPDPNIPLYLPDGNDNPAFEQYRNLVASVVMACPNLERLTGFHSWYNHEFDRLTHALSTRQHLREHSWIITENDDVTARCQVQLSPGLLDDHQVHQFLHYNLCWKSLETLMICSPAGAGLIEHHVFVRLFRSMPALKKLCISSFDADDFTDETLLSLPPLLTALRLEECGGISDSGLSRWAARPGADRIESLSLIHQNIHSLLTVSKLMACLKRLTKFTIIQSDMTPTLPANAVVMQPVLASNSLEWLHWDILQQDIPFSNDYESPNSYLALSILNAGFPNLSSLRAPRDVSPPGALQDVCRPAAPASVLLPWDKFTIPALSPVERFPSKSSLSRGNSLRAARIRAKGHIDANSKAPREFMRVLVTDHSRVNSYEEELDSASSTYSGTSTEGTDPNDLFSPIESRSSDYDFNGSIACSFEEPEPPTAPKRHSISKWPLSLQIPVDPSLNRSSAVPIPRRSPLRPRPIPPLKISEFSVPSFIGRVGNLPPVFNLKPDVEGYERNGGIIGWGELLRIHEKTKQETETDEDGRPWIPDGCSGVWNKRRHTERSRRRLGRVVGLEHFF